MECRSLDETIPVLEDFLALERVDESQGTVVMRHPNSAWPLSVHEAGPDAPPKQMHNHYGVRVQTKQEVDAAYAYLVAHKDEYGISEVTEPEFSHGSYSVYLLEPGTNGLEIECYEDVLRKESGGQRLGGVRSPHWDTPLDPSRFPGTGYVPQGLTHGTLACRDVAISSRFYSDVLGLDVHQAYGDRVVYVKHPDRKHYIVCARRPDFRSYSPNFRFTLALSSGEDVLRAHDALEAAPSGATELRDIETDGRRTSFLVADPDGNWWEVAQSHSARL
jgi:catechol 2,3-dioxygenase-like lactoylglutathione lyase family enzyme